MDQGPSTFFGVKPKSKDDAEDGSVQTRWFPSLHVLAGQALVQKAIKLGRKNFQIGEQFWTKEDWKELRTELQSAPSDLMTTVYKRHFGKFHYRQNRSFETCPTCPKFNEYGNFWVTHEETFWSRWLFFDDSHAKIIGDVDHYDVLDFLCDVPTDLTKLSVIRSYLSPDELTACLQKQTNIETLELKLSTNFRLSEYSTVLREKCANFSSIKLIFSVNYLEPEHLDIMLELLSRLRSIEILTITGSLSKKDLSKIWTVLAIMPRLSKLSLEPQTLLMLDQNLQPLNNVKSLTVLGNTDVVNVLFETFFPAMTNLVWNYKGGSSPLVPSANLGKVTKFDGRIALDPVVFLSHLTSAKSVRLFCPPYAGWFGWGPFENPNLTFLDVYAPSIPMSFEKFKLFFTAFPNLVTLNLTIPKLTNFNEIEFITFLEDNKSKFAKLKKFKLDFGFNRPRPHNNCVVGMSAKSILAILRNSNIVDFEDFLDLPFAGQDLEDLKSLSAEKGLKITPLYRDEEDQSIAYHTTKWYTCEQGKHTLEFINLKDG
jgi:hypothetical protein